MKGKKGLKIKKRYDKTKIECRKTLAAFFCAILSVNKNGNEINSSLYSFSESCSGFLIWMSLQLLFKTLCLFNQGYS